MAVLSGAVFCRRIINNLSATKRLSLSSRLSSRSRSRSTKLIGSRLPSSSSTELFCTRSYRTGTNTSVNATSCSSSCNGNYFHLNSARRHHFCLVKLQFQHITPTGSASASSSISRSTSTRKQQFSSSTNDKSDSKEPDDIKNNSVNEKEEVLVVVGNNKNKISEADGGGDKDKPEESDSISNSNSISSKSTSATSTLLSKETRNQIRSILTQAKSIPNIITISRICSTPILCNLIITEQYHYAVAGCFLAGFSDYLDGYIAKNYNQQTVFGTYLDPLADKILINSIAFSLSYVSIIPYWSFALWFGRDVLLVGMSYRAARIAARGRGHAVADPERTPLKIQPTMISKVNTVMQFGTIGVGLGLAAMGDVGSGYYSVNVNVLDDMMTLSVIDGMTYITGGTTVWSGLSYIDGKSMIKSGNSKSKSKAKATSVKKE